MCGIANAYLSFGKSCIGVNGGIAARFCNLWRMLGIVGKVLQLVKNVGYCGIHEAHFLWRMWGGIACKGREIWVLFVSWNWDIGSKDLWDLVLTRLLVSWRKWAAVKNWAWNSPEDQFMWAN
jgi:hypothetical protein